MIPICDLQMMRMAKVVSFVVRRAPLGETHPFSKFKFLFCFDQAIKLDQTKLVGGFNPSEKY